MPKNQMNKLIEPGPNEQLSESYISVGLGILVVVVVGILLYNFFTQKNASNEAANTENKVGENATSSAMMGNKYTVKEGDTLWSVAENLYKNGYNWTDLAKANNLTGDEELKVGQQLIVPSPTTQVVPTDQPVSTPAPVASADSMPKTNPVTITESSYTVVSGDTLWDIACRAYGDCYAWPKIFQANKLTDPDLIHPGNILVLPR